MGRNDRLWNGAILALKSSGGSHKTRFNRHHEVKRFVTALRGLGYGVKKWKKITNKHVGRVVDVWKEKGLAPATMKEYLSGVRKVLNYFGNESIKDNADFGIKNRVYVSNKDKSMPQDVYDKTISILENGKMHEKRVAAQLMLQRELGLRKEESFKFNRHKSILADDRVLVVYGKKGGRERVLNQVSSRHIMP